MDFRKTEIFFVIAFLFLDIFLFTTFQDKQEGNFRSANENTTIIEQMKQDDIILPEDLPTGETKSTYISAKKMTFSKEIAKEVSNDDQYVITEPDGSLYGTIQKQILLTDTKTTKELTTFVHTQAYQGEKYQYFARDDQSKKVIYVQEYKGIPILDGTAQVTVSLKDNSVDSASQALSYEQNYLADIAYLRDGEALISAQQGLEILYKNDEIPPGSTIVSVTLGYKRLLQLQDSDVYIPAWFVIVQKDGISQPKIVNAIEGKVIHFQEIDDIDDAEIDAHH